MHITSSDSEVISFRCNGKLVQQRLFQITNSMKYFAHKGIDFEGYELQKNIWLCNFSGLTSVLLQLQWLHFCAPPILICNHDTGTLAISQTRWEMQIFKCFLIQYYFHWSSTMSKEHNMSQFIWNLIPLTSWFWHKLPEWPMLSTISVTKEEDWKKSWLTLGATSETRVKEPRLPTRPFPR